jgi:hypothetical protein
MSRKIRCIMQQRRASAVLETEAACGAGRWLEAQRAGAVFATGYMALNKGKVANKKSVLRMAY